MRERPILFSTPMVRAILAGAKTQTRRVVKPQPDIVAEGGTVVGVSTAQDQRYGRLGKALRCPYGQPGERLWVREAFIHEPADYCWEASVSIPCRPAATVYRADVDGDTRGAGWTPSIHMPRSLSRITLEVTGVRVERLQDISKADAMAEGAPSSHRSIDRISRAFGYPDFPRSWYAQLWESINGPGSWDANPWVWVVEFRRANEKTHRPAALGAEHRASVGAVGRSGAAA